MSLREAFLEPLRRAVRAAPGATRLREIPGGASLDGSQLLEAIAEQARALRRAGARKGDRVLLCCQNGAAFAIGIFACWEAGASVLLADGEADAEMVRRLRRIFSPALVLGRRPGAGIRRPGLLPCWRPAERRGAARAPGPIAGEAVVKLTSGSTGAPRGVLVTEAQLVAGGRQILESMEIRPRDVNVAAIPMSHSYGFDNLILPLALQGSPLAVARSRIPAHLAAALEIPEPCVFPGVPYLFDLLCRSASPPRPGGLRLCISAGAPLPAALARGFRERFGLPLHNFYGASESGGIAYERAPSESCAEGNVGAPLARVRLEIAPVEGMDPGTEGGRVVVRSRAVAHGYTPEDPGSEPLGGGRFTTGDLGRIGPDGRLRLVGRLGLMINVGGRKVNPAELERALCALERVRDAVALGVADARRGQTLGACVEAAAGITRRLIMEELASRLPRHMLPRRVVVVEKLPRTERGKPDRERIRGLLES